MWRGLFAEPGTTISIKPDSTQQNEVLSVAPRRPARIALRGRVTTPSVQEDKPEGGSGAVEYEARYRFPFKVQITDANGGPVWSQESTLAWDEGSRSVSDESVSSTGGVLTVRWMQDRFTAPASGRIVVQAALEGDATYGAQLGDLQLEVFDDLAETRWYMLAGAAAWIVGLLLVAFGVVFAIAGAANAPAGSGAGPGAVPESARQRAMWCHLSGLAGYAIPFGSIVAPIALWIAWRGEDAYILEQGREAVNFQLSVFIYALVSVVLMLVLVGFILIFVLAAFQFVMTIIGAVRASAGEPFRYPVTLRFVRP